MEGFVSDTNEGHVPDVPQRLGRRSQRCGALWGDLTALTPFLYISRLGMARNFGHSAFGADERWFFTLGETDDDARPGLWHSGIILPFAHCRDPNIRALGPALRGAGIEAGNGTFRDRRRRADQVLSADAAGPQQLAERSRAEGFLTLRASPELFPYLHAHFACVTEVMVAADGKVTVTQTEQFPWTTCGALIEWHHWLQQPTGYRAVPAMTPHIVIDAEDVFRRDFSQMFCATRARTDENPATWFVLRPDVADAAFAIRFVMHECGWAELQVTLDGVVFQIDLSNVYDPFPDILDWGREVLEGDLPAVVEIDEEGRHTCLTALPTDDPARMLLRVSHPYLDRIAGEAVVPRRRFGKALQEELLRFFRDAFDPDHWDVDHGDGNEPTTREKSLAHPWLAGLALRLD
jgi:hypothetical protein